MKHYFKNLKLKEDASQEEIQAAYDKLSKELDPKNNDNQEFFVEEFKKVQEAYEALSNSSILANTSVIISDSNSDPKSEVSSDNNPKKIRMKPKKIKKIVSVFLVLVSIGLSSFAYYKFYLTHINSLVYTENKSVWLPSEISNDIVFLKSTMTPFTGKLSNLKGNYSGRFVNGKKDGTHKKYIGNGDLQYQGRYINGIPDGFHQEWHSNGQLVLEVNYKLGKRFGLSKIWNSDGLLIELDYGENNIKKYIKDYFKNSTDLDIIEGNYKTMETRGYEFSIINIYGEYYAVMTNNFINNPKANPKNEKYFTGEIKAVFSKNQKLNEYNFLWRMSIKNVIEKGTVKYEIFNNSLVFNLDYLNKYYKMKF